MSHAPVSPGPRRTGSTAPAPLARAAALASAAAAFALMTAAWGQDQAPAGQSPAGKAPAGESPAKQPPAEQVPADGPPPKVIEGTVNPYTFAPTDRTVEVDAQNANLRKIFEDLGPVATEWYQHVLTLSNPFFEGRAPGSRGSEVATEYFEFWMKQAGLEPAFPPDAAHSSASASASSGGAGPAAADSHGTQSWTSYRQGFTLPGGTAEVKSASMTANGATLVRGKDFEVMGNSGAGTVTAPLAFAGYALESGPDGYKSFAEGADFNGRVVVLFRYEPLTDEGRSQWSQRRFSENAAIAPKVAALAKRHAAGVILVNPPGAVNGREGLESTSSSAFGQTLSVPFVQLSEAQADALLKAADPQARSLMELRKAADKGTQKSMNLKDDVQVTITADLKEGGTPAFNVGGVVRGKGKLADEWVIVGGHYDHVGYGLFGADPRNRGKLHPGADDNASGSSAVLVLSKRVAEWMRGDESPEDVRSFLFMAFTAEESGLQGSREYTRRPTVELNKLAGMINLDMIGRLRDDDLSVAGTGTAENFMEILRPVFDKSGLTIHADPTGRGPSDHASFYGAGVPVLFLFTGTHDDYHKPTDKGYTVNPAGAAKVISLTESLARMMATRPEKLVFKSSDRTGGADRGYARVRLGVQPGLVGDGETGVKVESVSEGTSAADAGIQAGDVLLTWDGEALDGAAGMMEQLRGKQPGDKVKIKLKRGSETREVEVTLKASRPRGE